MILDLKFDYFLIIFYQNQKKKFLKELNFYQIFIIEKN